MGAMLLLLLMVAIYAVGFVPVALTRRWRWWIIPAILLLVAVFCLPFFQTASSPDYDEAAVMSMRWLAVAAVLLLAWGGIVGGLLSHLILHFGEAHQWGFRRSYVFPCMFVVTFVMLTGAILLW